MEFAFPRAIDDDGARPENRAVFDWWQKAEAPFDLHVSLHGMAFAGGPWYSSELFWASDSLAAKAIDDAITPTMISVGLTKMFAPLNFTSLRGGRTR